MAYPMTPSTLQNTITPAIASFDKYGKMKNATHDEPPDSMVMLANAAAGSSGKKSP